MQLSDHLTFGFDADARTVTLLGREYSYHHVMRTIIIVCAYALLRPYLLKLAGKYQAHDHAREIAEDADHQGINEDEDEEETGWGASAKRRQRELLQRLAEQQDVDEEDDRQLEALLED